MSAIEKITRRKRASLATGLALVAAVLGGAGCGGSAGKKSSTTGSASSTQAAPAGQRAAFSAVDQRQAVGLVRAYYRALIEQKPVQACRMLTSRARVRLERSSGTSHFCSANLKEMTDAPDEPGGSTSDFATPIPTFLARDPASVDSDDGSFDSSSRPEDALAQLASFPGHALIQPTRLAVFFGNLAENAVPVIKQSGELRIDGVFDNEFPPLLLDRQTPASRLNGCLLKQLRSRLTRHQAEYVRDDNGEHVEADLPAGEFSYTVGADADDRGGGLIFVTVLPSIRAAQYQLRNSQANAGAASISRIGSLITDWRASDSEAINPLPREYTELVAGCARASEVAL
jgi:hypothetical protein